MCSPECSKYNFSSKPLRGYQSMQFPPYILLSLCSSDPNYRTVCFTHVLHFNSHKRAPLVVLPTLTFLSSGSFLLDTHFLQLLLRLGNLNTSPPCSTPSLWFLCRGFRSKYSQLKHLHPNMHTFIHSTIC